MTIRWLAPAKSSCPNRRSGAAEPACSLVTVSPAAPPESLDAVRGKI
jgi:hypothetical protein